MLSLVALSCGRLPTGPIVASGPGEEAADVPAGTTLLGDTAPEGTTGDTTVATVIEGTTPTLDPSAVDPQLAVDAAVAVDEDMSRLQFTRIEADGPGSETCPGVPSPDEPVPPAGLARSRYARDPVVGPFIDYSARSFASSSEAADWVDTLKFRYIECAQSATLIEGRELPSTRTVDVPVGPVADVDQNQGLQNEVFFTEARQELFVVIQSVVTRRGPYVTVVSFTGGGASTPDAMAGLASYATTKLPT
ncbi:MAG: hypothetical protein GY929_19155 [Actinomycetia bacterium]|nr:hypothetical protein [Actinomycetes bacterium]